MEAALVLSDGSLLRGSSSGQAPCDVAGEVVLCSGQVGYHHALSDPTLAGKVAVLTSPGAGNYALPPAAERDSLGLVKHFQSPAVHAAAVVLPTQGSSALAKWLADHNVPVMLYADTRAVARRASRAPVSARVMIRANLFEELALLPVVDPVTTVVVEATDNAPVADTPEGQAPQSMPKLPRVPAPSQLAAAPRPAGIVAAIAALHDKKGPGEVSVFGSAPGRPTVLALDVGLLNGHIRSLVRRGLKVVVVPPHRIADPAGVPKHDAVFLTGSLNDAEVALATDLLHCGKPTLSLMTATNALAASLGAPVVESPVGLHRTADAIVELDTGRCVSALLLEGLDRDLDALCSAGDAAASSSGPSGASSSAPSSPTSDASPPWVPAYRSTSSGHVVGVRHARLPVVLVQFDPEPEGAVSDACRLLDAFATAAAAAASGKPVRFVPEPVSARPAATQPQAWRPEKVLVLGSGGLSISQGGEFDYNASQALKALRQERVPIVLVNPNVATVQTSTGLADKVYFLPITPEFVTQVIENEKPDAIMVAFGGQRALACAHALHQDGTLERANLRVIGTPIENIVASDDLSEVGALVGEDLAQHFITSRTAHSEGDAIDAAKSIGYPVIARVINRAGAVVNSGFAVDAKQLRPLLVDSLVEPGTRIEVHKSLKGWKHVEFEVLRDVDDNCVAVGNAEHFDPVGIHSTDSVVVVPIQTLSDAQFYQLRQLSLDVARSMGVVGACNVQFALSRDSMRFHVTGVNLRLSRNSVLVSKATGYPVAQVAAKLALGIRLTELRNTLTPGISACVEPWLDYVVVKFPRWDLKKFDMVSDEISEAVKSVGEVMALGRCFEEAVQKAIRMCDTSFRGFEPRAHQRATTDNDLRVPTHQRMFFLADALGKPSEFPLDKIHELSKIDPWFLCRLRGVLDLYQELAAFKADQLPRWLLLRAKMAGLSDRQISKIIGSTELAVREMRNLNGVIPYVKAVDGSAGRHEPAFQFLYVTYVADASDVEPKRGVFVLGGGPYRIGSSIEYDWSVVSCSRTLRELGDNAFVVNHNPEGVSTDYDECDRVYFEELSVERITDIYTSEKPIGIFSFAGGPRPYRIATALRRQNVRLLGTPGEALEEAQSRFQLSRLLDRLGVDQPRWKNATNTADARLFADAVGFPVLFRPVTPGSDRSVKLIHNVDDMEALLDAEPPTAKSPAVLSKFIGGAKELEVAGVAKGGEVVVHLISEHIENAGVHSGDATLVHPAQDLDALTVRKVEEAVRRIVSALNVSGPFNIGFIAKDNAIQVIECNLRCSRTFPFVSKTVGVNLMSLATRAVLDRPLDARQLVVDYVGVRVPQFSFTSLRGFDPVAGVEMASTGEVVCYGKTVHEAYLKATIATGFRLPKKNILLSVGSYKHKMEFLDSARKLAECGYRLFGTPGTADFLSEHGISITVLEDSGKASGDSNLMEFLSNAKIDLFINIPSQSKFRRPSSFVSRGYVSRRLAVDFSVPLITDIKAAKLFVEALRVACEEARGADVDQTAADPSFALRDCDMRTSHRMARLPGLVEPHLFLTSFPGEVVDSAGGGLPWERITTSALAGGFTTVCFMPSLESGNMDSMDLAKTSDLVQRAALCDFGLVAAAGRSNVGKLDSMAGRALGLAMLVDAPVESPFHLGNVSSWMRFFDQWPEHRLIVVRAQSTALAAVLLLCDLHKRPVHVCGISTQEDMLIIKAAKSRGLPVTCSVSPRHLFAATEVGASSSASASASAGGDEAGASKEDVKALWDNLELIDCFSSDGHDGFYALEDTVALLLTAVKDGRLTLDDISLRLSINPRRIFHLPEQADTYCEVDLDEVWTIPGPARGQVRPFSGRRVQGRITRVVLNGSIVYLDGKVLGSRGYGRDVSAVAAEAAVKAKGQMARLPAGTGVDATPAQTTAAAAAGAGAAGDADADGKGDGAGEAGGMPDTPKVRRRMSQSQLMPFDLAATDKRNIEFTGQSIVSVAQFNRDALHYLFGQAHEMRKMVERIGFFELLKGKVLGCIFYEPSTRTSSSFIAAMERLGGSVVAINSIKSSSVSKGESLADTVRTMEQYADVVVLRHPQQGAAAIAAKACRKPVINAGDGTGEHPTQALLDLFTIREEMGTVNGLTITLLGDLKHGRTVHSLARLLSMYDVKINYVSPGSLRMPATIVEDIKSRGIESLETDSLDQVLPTTDVLYVTRVQRERFENEDEYNRVKGAYVITPKTLTVAKDNMIIMHPLPRVDEISPEVDSDPRCCYFRQMGYGMYVRMALLAMVLGAA